MTKSFTQRQLDAISDFNWGAKQPPLRHRSKASEAVENALAKVDVDAQLLDSRPARPAKPAEDLAWH